MAKQAKKGSTKRKASKASKGSGRMTKFTEKGEDVPISCVDNAVKCIHKWLYLGVQLNLMRATQLITKKGWDKNGHGYEFTGQEQILSELDTADEQIRELRKLVKSGYTKDYGTAPVTQSELDEKSSEPSWKRERKSVKISA